MSLALSLLRYIYGDEWYGALNVIVLDASDLVQPLAKRSKLSNSPVASPSENGGGGTTSSFAFGSTVVSGFGFGSKEGTTCCWPNHSVHMVGMVARIVPVLLALTWLRTVTSSSRWDADICAVSILSFSSSGQIG